ncbi:MAG TPA: hypothetical protein VGH89_38160 [Pseudonocardia sp.]
MAGKAAAKPFALIASKHTAPAGAAVGHCTCINTCTGAAANAELPEPGPAAGPRVVAGTNAGGDGASGMAGAAGPVMVVPDPGVAGVPFSVCSGGHT